MKTYEITLRSGKTIEVDAPDPQTAAKVAARYEAQTAKPTRGQRRSLTSEVTGLMANFNRGLGIGDEIAAAGNTLVDAVRGEVRPEGPGMTGAIRGLASGFQRNMAEQRAIEDDFSTRRPVVAAGARGVGMTVPAAVPAGAMTAPTSLMSAGARGAVTAGTEAGLYELADRGTIQERVGAANRAIGPAMVVGGGLGMAGYALANRGARAVPTDEEQAAKVLRERAKANPADMRRQAGEMRDVGVEPTGLDVIGERGRRVVRATGVKTDTAGETLTQNAMTRSAETKPAVMSTTRRLVDDPRTATQYVDDLTTARSEAASTLYREPYATPVQIDADVAAALRGDPGRAAIQRARQAAIARQDYAQAQELDSLLAQNMDELPSVSAGTLDRIRIAMGERAETAGRRGARDIASGLRSRQGAITAALDNVEGLSEARATYRGQTQAIEAAGRDRLDIFSSDPADYARWVESLNPQAREANAIAIRQEILDTLGGQRQSTLGSLDELATSPYVRENLAAAVGEDTADAYIRNVAARLDQRRNAAMVTPGAGSRTAVLENDLGEVGRNVAAGARAVRDASTGNLFGFVSNVADWWRRRGVTPQQADALARAVTDPAMLDRVIMAVERREGREGVQGFLQAVAQAANEAGPADPAVAAINREVLDRLSRAGAATVAAPDAREPAVEVWMPTRPELGVGTAY